MPDLREEFEALMPEPFGYVPFPGEFYLPDQLDSEVKNDPLVPAVYSRAQMRAAMRSVAERAAKKWQPIETAPRDGTKFRALRRNEIAVAWVLVRDDGDIWNFGRSSACPEVFPSIVPTHWMPLPDEPDAAAIRAREGKGGAG